MVNPVKTNSSSPNDGITQFVAEVVDRWSVENEKELKLLTELAVVRKKLTEVKKSQGFISAKYEDLKLEHDLLLKVNKEKEFKKSYDLSLDLLQYRRENSAEHLYS